MNDRKTAGSRWAVSLQYEPRDLWIGVYWERAIRGEAPAGPFRDTLDLWICFLPTWPIHVRLNLAVVPLAAAGGSSLAAGEAHE